MRTPKKKSTNKKSPGKKSRSKKLTNKYTEQDLDFNDAIGYLKCFVENILANDNASSKDVYVGWSRSIIRFECHHCTFVVMQRLLEAEILKGKHLDRLYLICQEHHPDEDNLEGLKVFLQAVHDREMR